jgi:hypothetical protein
MAIIIELTPGLRNAQPPTPRYRHILRIANRQLSVKFPRKTISPGKEYNPGPNF